jgi:hypothetical protein
MPFVPQRQILLGLLLGATLLGVVLYLSGLATTVALGNDTRQGFLLVPALPTPLYVLMGLVALSAICVTLLASLFRRKKPEEPMRQRHSEAIKPTWLTALTLFTPLLLVLLIMLWLMRHGSQVQEWLAAWRQGLQALPASLQEGAQTFLPEVHSSLTGYALFIIVIVVYGGITLLGLCVLFERQRGFATDNTGEDRQARRVRKAVTSSLQALQRHADPRQAIIACYARLEHLLEDYGVPATASLTPQEYMGTALRGLDLPLDAFTGLVELFELARYSLHPLDEADRATAAAHLETIHAHLAWEAALASQS